MTRSGRSSGVECRNGDCAGLAAAGDSAPHLLGCDFWEWPLVVLTGMCLNRRMEIGELDTLRGWRMR